MPARNFDVQLRITGGLSLEEEGGMTLSPEAPVAEIPYLTEATNVLYEADNTIRSIGGAILGNSQPLPSHYMTSLIPIAGYYALRGIRSDGFFTYIDGLVSADDAEFRTWNFYTGGGDPLTLGATSAEWTASQFEGYDIIMSDEAGYLPVVVDTGAVATAANITAWPGAEPDLSMSEVYSNRLWAAGDPTKPSRLYYSNLNDPINGYSTQFIDIDPNGSDQITAIKQYRGKLVIFKGPTKGSIYILSGRTPSTFVLDVFSDSTGCLNPRCVADFGQDLLFLDTSANLRTMTTTEKYGDFETATITRDIRTWIRDNAKLNFSTRFSLALDPTTSRAWITYPLGANDYDSQLFVVDLSRGAKISKIDYVTPRSVAIAKSSDPVFSTKSRTRVVATNPLNLTSFHELDRQGSERVEEGWDGTAWVSHSYESSTLSPMISFLPTFGFNIVEKAAISITAESKKPASPEGTDCDPYDPSTSFTFVWQRDISTMEEVTISQTYGSRLAGLCIAGLEATTKPEVGHFVLDASRLGGPRVVESYKNLESFEFRRIAVGFRKEELDVGVSVHSITLKLGTSEGGSTENLL